jgi:hypothetical protein
MPSFVATNCVEFIENLETAFSNALHVPASHYQGPTGGIAFDLYLYTTNDSGEEAVALYMAFTFRE